MNSMRKKIERAADAIKFLIPLYGYTGWTDKGIRVTKWPKGFTKTERKLIRLVAKTALKAAKR